MKKPVTWIKGMAHVLLIFNSMGAFTGGYLLMRYPDGHALQLAPSLLQHTPFKNFFLPGLILMLANGAFSVLVSWMLLVQKPLAHVALMVQGVILGGWIVVQMLMIRTVFFLHIIFLLVAFAFLILGYLLRPSK